jgi:DNA-binding response OmpR family regulator
MRKWATILWHRPQCLPKLTCQPVIESAGVILDGARQRAQVDGHVVHLTARESAVLSVLMARAGRVVCRPALAAAAWGAVQVDPGALDRLVNRLRRRLEPSPLSPIRLHRVGNAGYTFGPAPSPRVGPPEPPS